MGIERERAREREIECARERDLGSEHGGRKRKRWREGARAGERDRYTNIDWLRTWASIMVAERER